MLTVRRAAVRLRPQARFASWFRRPAAPPAATTPAITPPDGERWWDRAAAVMRLPAPKRAAVADNSMVASGGGSEGGGTRSLTSRVAGAAAASVEAVRSSVGTMQRGMHDGLAAGGAAARGAVQATSAAGRAAVASAVQAVDVGARARRLRNQLIFWTLVVVFVYAAGTAAGNALPKAILHAVAEAAREREVDHGRGDASQRGRTPTDVPPPDSVGSDLADVSRGAQGLAADTVAAVKRVLGS
jgi:hypothetical protein